MSPSDPHGESLATSTALSAYYVTGFIPPLEVIRVLNRAGVRFLLVGSHSLGGWTKKPRAAEDVDVLVAVRDHPQAVAELSGAFPHLEVIDSRPCVRLRESHSTRAIIDVWRPGLKLFQAALKHPYQARCEGVRYLIPSLEAVLAITFRSMRSLPWANPDKYQSIHDFLWMARREPAPDLDRLAEFGELAFPGGGREVVEKVRQARAGEKLNL